MNNPIFDTIYLVFFQVQDSTGSDSTSKIDILGATTDIIESDPFIVYWYPLILIPVTIILTILTEDYIRNREIKKQSKLKFDKSWNSYWLNIDEASSDPEDWETERVKLSVSRGKLIIKNSDNSKGWKWQGDLEMNGDEFHGSWYLTNENASSNGVMVLIKSKRGKFMYGYYTDSEYSNKLIPWIITRDMENKDNIDQCFLEARKCIMNPFLRLKTDESIDQIPPVLHFHHKTGLYDEEVWRYHKINFIHTNDEVLIGKLNSVNKKGKDVFYKIQAVFKGDHLLLQYFNPNEPVGVVCFPFYRKMTHSSVYGGVLMGGDWDNKQQLTKAFIRDEKLNKNHRNAEIIYPIDHHEIEKEWEKTRFSGEQTSSFEIINGTNEIYKFVYEHFKSRSNYKDTLSIDILGYTLFSVEPHLKSWLESDFLNNININLFHIDSIFAKESDSINNSWSPSVDHNINLIKSFVKNNREILDENHVTISLFPYKRIPGIHGFSFNNSKYFLSFSSWDTAGQINYPNTDRFFVLSEKDNSQEDYILKELFDNWRESILALQ